MGRWEGSGERRQSFTTVETWGRVEVAHPQAARKGGREGEREESEESRYQEQTSQGTQWSTSKAGLHLLVLLFLNDAIRVSVITSLIRSEPLPQWLPHIYQLTTNPCALADTLHPIIFVHASWVTSRRTLGSLCFEKRKTKLIKVVMGLFNCQLSKI